MNTLNKFKIPEGCNRSPLEKDCKVFKVTANGEFYFYANEKWLY